MKRLVFGSFLNIRDPRGWLWFSGNQILVTILLLGITGCGAEQASQAQSRSEPGTILPANTLAVEVQSWPQDTPSPTSVIAVGHNVLEPEPQVSITKPDLKPLEFAFPTVGPEAISLWRPPLYPTPWEPTPQDHFYLIRPIGADEVNWPLARYRYGYLFYSEPHTGIDIPAPKGTPILAAGTGTVIHAGYGLYFMREDYRDPYGIAVAIKHDFGYQGQVIYTVMAT